MSRFIIVLDYTNPNMWYIKPKCIFKNGENNAYVDKLTNIDFLEINHDKTWQVPFSISKIKSYKLNEVI